MWRVEERRSRRLKARCSLSSYHPQYLTIGASSKSTDADRLTLQNWHDYLPTLKFAKETSMQCMSVPKHKTALNGTVADCRKKQHHSNLVRSGDAVWRRALQGLMRANRRNSCLT